MTKSQLALVLLITVAIGIIQVAPDCDLLPTTLGDHSAAHIFLPTTLGSAVYALVLAISGSAIVADFGIISPELLSLTCTRLC